MFLVTVDPHLGVVAAPESMDDIDDAAIWLLEESGFHWEPLAETYAMTTTHAQDVAIRISQLLAAHGYDVLSRTYRAPDRPAPHKTAGQLMVSALAAAGIGAHLEHHASSGCDSITVDTLLWVCATGDTETLIDHAPADHCGWLVMYVDASGTAHELHRAETRDFSADTTAAVAAIRDHKQTAHRPVQTRTP
ncbi:hypothetical protein [Streptomyces sp. NPDC020681]|uniref:hypothetical protein n=1 Tax=Streptomyces sp. NPDC020681 TaxID=3365083 RepID=UPI00379903AC